jgi:hypothetical protein
MFVRKLFLIFIATLPLFFTAACEREGTMERTGERIDRSTERAGENVERSAERAGERVDNPMQREQKD